MTPDSLALCVPAYNAERFLPRLMAGVAAQSRPFDEVWVYDDASTDATAEVARQLGARVVIGHPNVGCAAGKNRLLEHVGCAWVHFHDADDELEASFVARAKSRIATGGFEALLCDYEQVEDATGQLLSRSDFTHSALLDDPLAYMLEQTVNNAGVYLVSALRRVGGFDTDPAVLYNEDRAFHLRLAEAGLRFALEPHVGVRFRSRSGSMSAGNRIACIRAHQEITRRFAAAHPGRYSRLLANLSWRNAAGLATCLDWVSADACVALACALDGRIPAEGSLLFRTLCLFGPRRALRIRESLIRRFRPHLRRKELAEGIP